MKIYTIEDIQEQLKQINKILEEIKQRQLAIKDLQDYLIAKQEDALHQGS